MLFRRTLHVVATVVAAAPKATNESSSEHFFSKLWILLSGLFITKIIEFCFMLVSPICGNHHMGSSTSLLNCAKHLLEGFWELKSIAYYPDEGVTGIHRV